MFYGTLTDEHGSTQEVTYAVKENWGSIWNAKNEEFNRYLLLVPELSNMGFRISCFDLILIFPSLSIPTFEGSDGHLNFEGTSSMSSYQRKQF